MRVLKLEGDEMSVDRCVESMLDFSSIHLACHGSQNAAEPLQSRFIFHRGSLELGTILKSDLKNADLAFLSACQTSTGDEKISDEAVHLAAGMLAAGYRRVVATMWSIGDRPAQEVATDFYDFIFSRRKGDSGDTFDATLSAHACSLGYRLSTLATETCCWPAHCYLLDITRMTTTYEITPCMVILAFPSRSRPKFDLSDSPNLTISNSSI